MGNLFPQQEAYIATNITLSELIDNYPAANYTFGTKALVKGMGPTLVDYDNWNWQPNPAQISVKTFEVYSDTVTWRIVGGEALIWESEYPVISIPAGTLSIGTSNQLTLSTPLPRVYSEGAVCCCTTDLGLFPANTQPGCVFFVKFSSTTVGTIYAEDPYTAENLGITPKNVTVGMAVPNTNHFGAYPLPCPLFLPNTMQHLQSITTDINFVVSANATNKKISTGGWSAQQFTVNSTTDITGSGNSLSTIRPGNGKIYAQDSMTRQVGSNSVALGYADEHTWPMTIGFLASPYFIPSGAPADYFIFEKIQVRFAL